MPTDLGTGRKGGSSDVESTTLGPLFLLPILTFSITHVVHGRIFSESKKERLVTKLIIHGTSYPVYNIY